MSKNSKTRSDIYDNLRRIVNRVPEEAYIWHPNPDNKCRFVPIPKEGVTFPASSFATTMMVGGLFTLHEGDLIVYTLQTSDEQGGTRTEFMARVLAIAVRDGVADELDPPHLAVMTLATDCASAYFRLVAPKDVYASLSDPKRSILEWFTRQSGDFTCSRLPVLLLAENYGTLHAGYLNDNLDEHGRFKPSPAMVFNYSIFVYRQQRAVRINGYLWDFEQWLHSQGYHKHSGDMAIRACDLLQVYLTTVQLEPYRIGELQLHAAAIGNLFRD